MKNLLLFLVLVAATYATVNDKYNWPMVGADYENTNFAEKENTLRKQNIKSLALAWKYDLPQIPGALHFASVDAHPAIFEGIAYFGSTLGVVYAYDVRLGTQVWAKNLSTGFNDMAVVEEFQTTPFVNKNFVYIADNNVFCLNRSSGAIVWQRPVWNDGSVGPDGRPTRDYNYVGDLVEVESRIIFGVASNQNSITTAKLLNVSNNDLTFAGSVVAFHALTGNELWRFYTTSLQTGGNVQYGAGAGVWSSPAIDEDRNLVFIGTGNAYEPPASPYSDSLLAINYITGQLVWSKQMTSGDVYGSLYPTGVDWDVGNHPNLFDACVKLPGMSRSQDIDMVGVGDKRGRYYIFPRDQPNPNSIVIYANVSIDVASRIGGFQSTPAYVRGNLYAATHAKINTTSGARVSFDVPNQYPGGVKITAMNVENLVEGTPFVEWDTDLPPAAFGIAFGPVTAANNIIFVTSLDGYLRVISMVDGTVIESASRLVSVAEWLIPGVPLPVPIYGGATIYRGYVCVPFGASFFLFAPGGMACYTLPKNL